MDVVVVNFNTREHLNECLAAVPLEDDVRVVVVDNASSDDSGTMVRERYPRVALIANRRNVGYGAAANQGIATCTSEHVLVMNSDVVIGPGTLEALGQYLEHHPRVALVGPRLTQVDGRLQSSCNPFPTLLPTLLAESAVGPLLRHVPVVREHYLPTSSHARPRRVPWVMGAAMAIRRGAFDAIGGFDPSFFMYFEEVDLCYRMAAAGWEVHFAPVTNVVHVGAASTRHYRSDMAVQALASRLHFYRRHYPGPRVVALVLLIDAIVLLRLVLGPVRLGLSRDEQRRAQLSDELVAWRRALLGEWLRSGCAMGR